MNEYANVISSAAKTTKRACKREVKQNNTDEKEIPTIKQKGKDWEKEIKPIAKKTTSLPQIGMRKR